MCAHGRCAEPWSAEELLTEAIDGHLQELLTEAIDGHFQDFFLASVQTRRARRRWRACRGCCWRRARSRACWAPSRPSPCAAPPTASSRCSAGGAPYRKPNRNPARRSKGLLGTKSSILVRYAAYGLAALLCGRCAASHWSADTAELRPGATPQLWHSCSALPMIGNRALHMGMLRKGEIGNSSLKVPLSLYLFFWLPCNGIDRESLCQEKLSGTLMLNSKSVSTMGVQGAGVLRRADGRGGAGRAGRAG